MDLSTQSLRVLLLGNYHPDAQESMQRFTDMLADGLRNQGQHVHVIRPEPVLIRQPLLRGRLAKWTGYADKFLLFPKTLRRAMRSADIVHVCDHSNAMYVPYLDETRHLVTCHDLTAIKSALGEVPAHPTRWSGRLLQNWILKNLKRARHVACVSRQTADDLRRLAGHDHATTIYNGLNYPYTPMPWQDADARLKSLLHTNPGSYFLHVGGNQWYKNRLGVVEIFHHLRQRPAFKNHKLILAGKPWSLEIRDFVRGHALQDAVLELCDVDNEDLRALYTQATAFLFPSLQEGFGWPIIEAQACGCPVFTTHYAPMTEVGGDAAAYIDPAHPEQAASIIEAHLSQLRSMQLAGFINVRRFLPERMIDNYLRLYQTIAYETAAVHPLH